MKIRSSVILIILLFVLMLSGFAPASQDQTSLISLDIEGLTKQIEESITEQTSQLIAALELRIKTLEEKIAVYDQRIVELERLAQIPTATPVPTGSPAPTEVPTRTPNPTGYDCETQLLSPYYFGEFRPDSEFLFQVRITNVGSKTWDKDVTIQYVEGLKAEVEDQYAYALPVQSVAPNESFDISILMRAPVDKKNDGKHEAIYALNDGDENFCEFGYNIYVP